MFFSIPNIAKNVSLKKIKMGQILTEKLDCEVILSELKIQSKVGL